MNVFIGKWEGVVGAEDSKSSLPPLYTWTDIALISTSFYFTGHTSAFYPTKSQFFRSFVSQKAGCLVVESYFNVPNKSGFPQHTNHTKLNQFNPLFSLVGTAFSISRLKVTVLPKGPPKKYLLIGLLREL